MIIVDTSGVVARFDRGDRYYAAVTAQLLRPDRRIMSPFVLAEADELLTRIAGTSIANALLQDVADGAYELAPFDADDVALAMSVIERYADLQIGLADATIVVLAQRYRCHDILTLDQRHFRALSALDGRPFRLLPLDAA